MQSSRSHAEQMSDLASLWTTAQSAVAAYICCSIHDFHDAEDVLQQVAQKIATNFDQYDRTRPFVPWAIGVARHQLLAFFRKRDGDRHTYNPEVLELLTEVYGELSPELDEMKEALDRCLKKATPRSRQILEMRYLREMKPARIAQEVGTTANTISVLLHRIREALANCISERMSANGGGGR